MRNIEQTRAVIPGGSPFPQLGVAFGRLPTAKLLLVLAAAGVAALVFGLALPSGTEPRPAAASGSTAHVDSAYGKLPMRFEANRGQTASQVEFLSRGAGYSLFLTPREAVLSLTKPASGAERSENPTTAVVRMGLMGANPKPELEGGERLAGVSNYLTGKDPRKWQTNVPGYSDVKYRNAYPGIDLVFHGKQRQLEYDFVVAPGRDPGAINLRFQGADKLGLDRRGDLVMQTKAGMVRQRAPVAYQLIAGQRRPVEARFVLDGKRLAFSLGNYDRSRPLVIDPVLSYSTYLGGDTTDRARGIAVDSSGSAYVTGIAGSVNFPTAGDPPLQRNRNTGGSCGFECNDVFVTKFNPQGSALVYSTYLGGGGTEDGAGIAVDSDGRAYVTGQTASPDFPTTENAFQPELKADSGGDPGGAAPDSFVSVLNPGGSALAYSTFLGGSKADSSGAIAIDRSGKAYVTGQTGSSDFPSTTGAFDATLAEVPNDPFGTGGDGHHGEGGVSLDAFVSELDPSASGAASLVASTYLGGQGGDGASGIAVDGAGAYVSGRTSSTDFPTTAGAFQGNRGGDPGDSFSNDGFVTKLDPALSELTYSTYLGGGGFDSANGIAVDGEGAYVTGGTSSADFPTRDPFQAQKKDDQDAFVTKLSSDGSSLSYSSYLGGVRDPDEEGDGESASGIAVDRSGGAFVTGLASSDFPILDPVAPQGAKGDPFLARVNPGGTGLSFASYLGGGGVEYGGGVAVDPAGSAYVAGSTSSTDFPTRKPVQAENAGIGVADYTDAFVAKVAPDSPGAPLVTGVSPRSGPAGTRVALTGRGFRGASAVRFGGQPASRFTVESDSRITAVSPPHAEGPVAVTVSKATGTSPGNPSADFVYAEGRWAPTGSLGKPAGTATLLPNGKVLVVGGGDDTAKLYDPTTGDSVATDSLASAREGHTATLLSGPACRGGSPPDYCGKVLVAGGGASGGFFEPDKTAELYDPRTGKWSRTGEPATARSDHSATLLPNGKVLVVGGSPGGFEASTKTAELYDPATGTWSAAAPLTQERTRHTATLISGPACAGSSPPPYCGRVLVAGGEVASFADGRIASAELYDPEDDKWSDTDPLGGRRARHTATLLRDGTVLVAGGRSGISVRSAERYNPATGSWSVTGPLPERRSEHAATLLGNGKVLVAGGQTTSSHLNTAVLYDPARQRWNSAGVMTSYRQPVFAALLSGAPCGANCGKVLVGGGGSSAELYTPSSVGCPPGTSSGVTCQARPGGGLQITGTAGRDTIVGTGENDVIVCGGGDDVVAAGPGDDVVSCGAGNDRINGGGGDDRIDGGSGNDRISGSTGDDVVLGGSGDDLVAGNEGEDTLRGGVGNDTLFGNEDNDVLAGEVGNDRMAGGSGNDRGFGASGDDLVIGNGGNDLVVGNDGRDRLNGNEGNDVVNGEAGNDSMAGSSGRDRMSGGSGNDRASGGTGEDAIRGGVGNDVLSGNEQDDVISGEAGNDHLFGGPGRDRLGGGPGRDQVVQ